ncbi:hypothetical protein C8R47DRAFT_1226211 [Mycena vitilis]|nr:hypothetical protein C8R47DRAFT_1226211 [Mycena vitilis]
MGSQTRVGALSAGRTKTTAGLWGQFIPIAIIGSANHEQRNAATRARMARLRAQDATLPPDVLEARLAARREAARKYREKRVFLRTSFPRS